MLRPFPIDSRPWTREDTRFFWSMMVLCQITIYAVYVWAWRFDIGGWIYYTLHP